MHNDEANQAVKFGELLERREYRYDAFDHHGPTLYYLTLPAAWLRGQASFAALDEYTLRSVPAVFGAATILLLLLLAPGVGRTAVAASAVLMAVSPAMVFYSRMYIQESMFACFTLLFAIAVGRAITEGGVTWPVVAGLAAGLTVATKETSVLVLPASLLAAGVSWWSLGAARPKALSNGGWRDAAIVSAFAAAAVVVLFYSSFFTDPGGVLGPFRAAGTYIDRGVDPANHVQPWHYYLGLLTWSSSGGLTWTECLILVLALGGAIAATRSPRASEHSGESRWWLRFITLNSLVATVVFSAIPYKTPWNLLPFYVLVIVLAGIGFAALVAATSSRAVHVALATALGVGAVQLGWQAWRAAVPYGADQRNPYVYAHTVPDAVRMARRIRDLAAMHPARDRMLVTVIAPPHEQWPLPWYLRTMPNVGYWTEAPEALALNAPVVVSSSEHVDEIDKVLGERYVSEFYGLRPEVLLTLYVERGLWERYLARVR
jgi:uncharacterized protein (TIGR03663 family)